MDPNTANLIETLVAHRNRTRGLHVHIYARNDGIRASAACEILELPSQMHARTYIVFVIRVNCSECSALPSKL